MPPIRPQLAVPPVSGRNSQDPAPQAQLPIPIKASVNPPRLIPVLVCPVAMRLSPHEA